MQKFPFKCTFFRRHFFTAQNINNMVLHPDWSTSLSMLLLRRLTIYYMARSGTGLSLLKHWSSLRSSYSQRMSGPRSTGSFFRWQSVAYLSQSQPEPALWLSREREDYHYQGRGENEENVYASIQSWLGGPRGASICGYNPSKCTVHWSLHSSWTLHSPRRMPISHNQWHNCNRLLVYGQPRETLGLLHLLGL